MTREELTAKLEYISQNAPNRDDGERAVRIISSHLMLDANYEDRPNADDLAAAEEWIEQYKEKAQAQTAELQAMLDELG